ncbi:DNA polymerase III subunit beta [Terrilactibacillus sp. BCM23-1]|uniref:Beta sliding clamp n=1 Tax=Terrilactibacillus tamarindi TaxID=2599694 RepID=A0A6N8CMC7_9BACI|nr:DNA polymerase III subunit beta [Terrilactibacillus tamarindi]MTT31051.1 DNA polymerase III subunit beta [Terrilactibacillus tamarindi]
MKMTVTKDKLVESVNHVMKAVSSRTTIPILTGIKITASLDGVTLTGSDSDVSIKSFIPLSENDQQNVTIEKTGQIVLQAKVFSDIVRKLPSDTIEIEVDQRLITKITAGSSEFTLNGLDPEEYPLLPVIDEEDNNIVTIKKDLLKHVIRQTVYAVSTSETRPILTGVKWDIQNGKLDCVSTDSHRLAQRVLPITTDDETNYQNIVIPGKSLNELYKILDDNSEESVRVIITNNQVLFKVKNIDFFSRLLDGNYPDTNRLIPTDSKTTITLSTKGLLHAIERASLLAKEERNNVVKLRTHENSVEILSQSAELGRVYEDVPVEKIEGEDLKISFSAKLTMEALSRIDAQTIQINFTGAMRPFVIRPVGDDGILMLVLPVRTF